jgi:hypothetical protein
MRLPAQYGREVVRSMAQRVLMGMGVLVVAAVFTGTSAGWTSPTFIVVEASVVGALLAADRWIAPRIERRDQGNLGEIKVAKILAESEPDGWRALHDVQTGHGNIDHLVVGPGGILTIETKSRKGKLSVDSLDPAWLSQAYAQCKWIERITGHQADALLVFSDAYLDRPVSRQRGVCVVPARMLRGHLARRRGQLSPDEVKTLHARLAHALADI